MADTSKGNPRSSGYEQERDGWYVESAEAVDKVISAERFGGIVWDPCCGGGNIPRQCYEAGVPCIGTDIVDRAGGLYETIDFLGTLSSVSLDARRFGARDILSNPPFRLTQRFVERALLIVPGKIVVLQRLAWLEGQARRPFFMQWLSHVWVHSSRISMPPGGQNIEAKGGSVAYCWFVFRRPGHTGPWTGGFLP